MRRAISIRQDLDQIHVVGELTDVFESIASLRIARIRNRVVVSKEFFSQLWMTYRDLRINPKERMKRAKQANTVAKTALMVVTSEGKLSGQIDEDIIEAMLKDYTNPQTTDVIVIGSHGASQLEHKGIPMAQAFTMPASDTNFSVQGIIDRLTGYSQITVYYQTYESLRLQTVAKIELIAAVQELGKDVAEDTEVVSSRDYIFEPNINEIADYMESLMMGVALIQVIMESKLAQYANRFNSMNAAKRRATELTTDYQREFYHAKRAESDERLKEIMKVVKANERRRAY